MDLDMNERREAVELSTTPGAMLGYFRGRPFYLIAGASPDDPDNGPDDDGGDSDDAGGAGGDGADDSGGDGDGTDDAGDGGSGTGDQGSQGKQGKGRQAPAGKSGTTDSHQDDGLQRALASERALRKQRDAEIRELKKKHATAEELALMQAREAGAADATANITPKLMKRTAAAELRAAGVSGDTSKLVGLLDLDKVTMTEDGELAGLDDQIAELKEEFPILFATSGRPAPAKPAGKANGGAGGGQGRQQDKSGGPTTGRTEMKNGERGLGFADKLASQVLGGT
jgi:hypothetical protein